MFLYAKRYIFYAKRKKKSHLSTVNQINGMSDRVEALMKDQTEELKVSIFDSTIEMKNATTLSGGKIGVYNSDKV